MSDAFEAKIAEAKSAIADPELARLFENCFPNTLDTDGHFRHALETTGHPGDDRRHKREVLRD